MFLSKKKQAAEQQKTILWIIQKIYFSIQNIHVGLYIKTLYIYECIHSVMSDSLWSQGLKPARLLCPWNFPGKNTGVWYHFLLQRIFLTQGLNLCVLHLLHGQADSLLLHHLGSPNIHILISIFIEGLRGYT